MTDPAPASVPEGPDGDPLAALGREIETLRAEVERLRALADHDVLVPALNRRAFVRELSRTLAACKRYGTPAALIYLDLDGFKSVNDRMGHLAGDAALVRVTELLTAHVRESDTVARLGGDEFGLLLQHADRDAALAKAESLAQAVADEPFVWEGVEFTLGGSFGVRAFEGQDTAEAWLAQADAAMFVRKRAR
jgi:diguanylate cyclase (GGDEF)-like protein